MVVFEVSKVNDLSEYAVTVKDTESGNTALFLVFTSQGAAERAAELFTYLSRQYNQLFPNGQ